MQKALRGLFASVARTADPVAVEVNEPSYDGCRIIIDVTAITSTPSVVFNVEAFDDASGKWVLLLASAAIATVVTVVLAIGPTITPAANVAAQAVLPRRWRVRPVHGNANSITYTAAAHMYGAA
jgi:hypothetical protein